MEVTDKELNYIVNLLANRPLAESLELYLKLTRQRLVSLDDERKASATPITTRRAGDPP